jgi:hypothetical protein
VARGQEVRNLIPSQLNPVHIFMHCLNFSTFSHLPAVFKTPLLATCSHNGIALSLFFNLEDGSDANVRKNIRPYVQLRRFPVAMK